MAIFHLMKDLASCLLEAEVAILPSAHESHGQQGAANLCSNLAATLDAIHFSDSFLWERIATGAANMICPLNGAGLGQIIETALEAAGKTEVLESLRKQFTAIRMHLVMSQFTCDDRAVQAVKAFLRVENGAVVLTEEQSRKLDVLLQERLHQVGRAIRGVEPETKLKYLLAHGLRPGVILSVLQAQ
ncbi:TPA: hypothetical protein ACKRQV_001231 [Pseudomonas aeruginosa]|nr:hypothetical protein [Pseudomonas aeruginosa]EIU2864420.1 hypothetical protein [Pseudomonas aeruginosa]